VHPRVKVLGFAGLPATSIYCAATVHSQRLIEHAVLHDENLAQSQR